MGASVWECTCGSPAATPSSPPPLPLPSPPSAAQQCLLHIGCRGADVMDVSWSGLGGCEFENPAPEASSSYSGNRASNPRGEEERSSALPRGLASLQTTAESVSAAAAASFLPGSPCPENQVSGPRPSPVFQLPPQVTATSHIKLEANLSCLVTNPQVPSPLFTPACEGGD